MKDLTITHALTPGFSLWRLNLIALLFLVAAPLPAAFGQVEVTLTNGTAGPIGLYWVNPNPDAAMPEHRTGELGAGLTMEIRTAQGVRIRFKTEVKRTVVGREEILSSTTIAEYTVTADEVQSYTVKPAHAGHVNPGFEEPRGREGGFTFVEALPGWQTTDEAFEIWSTGFMGVESHEGTQFVELNAKIDGTLFQDSEGIEQGAVLEFTFAHRGRNGEDTLQLTITDLGTDNALGGGDDMRLFMKQYTTGKSEWVVYDSTGEDPIRAIGNTVRFAYTAVHGTGGRGPDKTEGNFLDAADFGVGVVSEAVPHSKKSFVTHNTHKSEVLDIAWSTDSRKIASKDKGSNGGVWDAATGKADLWGGTFEGKLLGWSPDGTTVAYQRVSTQVGSVAGDSDVCFLNYLDIIGDINKQRSLFPATTDFAWSWPRLLYATNESVEVMDGLTATKLVTLKLKGAYKVAWSVDGSKFAVATPMTPAVPGDNKTDRDIQIYDGGNGRLLASIKAPLVESLEFSPDGSKIAAGAAAELAFDTIYVWDTSTGKELLTIKDPGAHEVKWSPDGTRLSTGCKTGHSVGVGRVWDSKTGAPLLTFQDAARVRAGQWSSDGRMVATQGDYNLGVWNSVNGGSIHQQEFDSKINEVAWAPDGRKLAVALGDGTVRILATTSATPDEQGVGVAPGTSVPMVTAGDSETMTGTGGIEEHIITNDLESQHGAVWSAQKINFNENFKISAEIYLGSKGDGADGLALAFQAKDNQIVSTGSGIGYQGISPSIAIEFDTYQNKDENNDPVEDHVGLRINGDPIHTGSDYVEVEDLEDGKYHPITFEWNASQQTFSLTLDGKQIFKDTKIPENGLAGQQAYVGFTAATGLYSNLHKVRSISSK